MLETSASQPQSQYTKEASYPSLSEVTTIICPICQAVYAPSHLHSSFLLSSNEALESAFMSLCHFCFRCRRPACSQCWDGVHGVCGDCVCQAHLSFRTEAAPLDGVRFPPLRSQGVPHEEVASSLLVCVKAGRFLLETELADGMTVEAVKMNEKKPAQQSKIFEDVATVRPAKLPEPVQEPVTVTGAVEVGEDNEADEEVVHRPHTPLRVLRVLERVLTVLALVVLVAIIVLVALAQFSAAANTLIIQVVHIDIRAEIAYLVHLVQQLH